MTDTRPTLDLDHEVRPQAGSAYDALGRWAPRMLDRQYPVTAICVQCHRVCACADGTADWAHVSELIKAGGITREQVLAAVARRVHKAAPSGQEPERCATCGWLIKQVPGGQGMTWVHSATGAVAATNPPSFTWPAGKTFGELSPDEKAAATRQAADRLQDELQSLAPQIGRILTEADQGYKGVDIERVYVIADHIQQRVLETQPVGTWWTFSRIARFAVLRPYTPQEIGAVLDWMVEHQYIITNGRGGCWINWGRKS